MGTTLTGTTPQDTYDSLIKVTDNGPLSGTAKYLSDGLGNDSVLALSTSRVGVGTATPNQPLTIGATNGYPVIDFENSNTAYGDVGFQVDKMVLSAYTTTPLTFWTNSNERLRIDSSGNVGIGTSAPAYKLQVSGASPAISINRTSGDEPKLVFTASGTDYGSIIANASNGQNQFSIGPTVGWGGSHVFITNTVERVRVTDNGLTFNGDTAAANALDDYEEGTWTMGVAFGGASVGVTYINNAGRYTKIGRQVTASGYLALSSKGSSTGDAEITGLPFTNVGIAAGITPVTLRYDSVSFANTIQGFLNAGETKILLGEITEAGVATNLTNADFQNGSSIMVSVTYTV